MRKSTKPIQPLTRTPSTKLGTPRTPRPTTTTLKLTLVLTLLAILLALAFSTTSNPDSLSNPSSNFATDSNSYVSRDANYLLAPIQRMKHLLRSTAGRYQVGGVRGVFGDKEYLRGARAGYTSGERGYTSAGMEESRAGREEEGNGKGDDTPAGPVAQQDDQQQPSTNTPLALPSSDPSSTHQTLDLGGSEGGSTTIKLDHLGPMVVNADGTLSRIANWEEMTERERENTMRVLGKRNRERLGRLRREEEGD